MLVRRNLNPVIYTKDDVHAEVVWCKIHPNPKTEVLCGVIYGHKQGGEPNLHVICDSIGAIDTDNVILVGDFQLQRYRLEDKKLYEAHTPCLESFLNMLKKTCYFN